jgi:O-antigen ligase
MGLFLTLFYIFTAYMAPSTLFGALVQYHVEVIVAIFTLIGSLLASEKPPLFQMPQTFILFGLCAATMLSIATNGWLGGAQTALFEFLPHLFTFFFIVLNCRTIRHVKLVIAVLVFVCFWVTANGTLAITAGDITSPYLLPQHNDAGVTFYRLTGLGFINDPNDLGQVMVSLCPCMFFFWRPKRGFFNMIFVLMPVAILIYAIYFTHSRGAMIALLVVIMISVRRKLGTIPSVMIAFCLFALSIALGWTGNRGVSVEAGQDRMDAWSAGLEMIKQHPIFGVGYGAFTDHYILTAHNTIVVCAAEIGTFGLFLWLMFVCSSIWEAMTIAGPLPEKVVPEEERMTSAYAPVGAITGRPGSPGRPGRAVLAPQPQRAYAGMAHAVHGGMGGAAMLAPGGSIPLHLSSPEEADPEESAVDELRRCGRLMMISLSGFLAAGWFLSRAFQMTLFVYCGIIQVIYQVAVAREMVPAQLPVGKIARIAAISGVCLLVVVYLALLVEHHMGIH